MHFYSYLCTQKNTIISYVRSDTGRYSFSMFYASVAILSLMACYYLLFRRANAIAPELACVDGLQHSLQRTYPNHHQLQFRHQGQRRWLPQSLGAKVRNIFEFSNIIVEIVVSLPKKLWIGRHLKGRKRLLARRSHRCSDVV
jgi:hypothetical protein